MSKKILIISGSEEESATNPGFKKGDKIASDDESHYPLGIAYLHAYLETQGHEVRTLFLSSYSSEDCFNEVKTMIESWLPDIIGFQVLASTRVSTYELIEYFHKNYPHIKLLVGGIHATIMYKQLITKFPFLIAVLGEGELTFAELVNNLWQDQLDLNKVDGIAFWDNGEIKITAPRKLIADLDSLPFPKHEVFFHPGRTLGNILTTRGCPFNCSFCCLDTISQRKVRYRSVNNVVDEIEYMISSFPQMVRIWIHDDTFFIDNQRVIDFCDEIVRRGIKIKFVCSGRFKPLSEAVVKKLEEANFIHVMFGLESGNQEILNRAHKAITRQDAINAYTLFAKSKINIFSFLIVGLPGETKETIIDTGLFIQELQKIKYTHYSSGIGILTVYPGTEIYEITKEVGMINDNYWLKEKPTPFFLVEHNYEELFALKKLLLDYISCDKIFTWSAFKKQWYMIPYIIKDKRVRNDLIMNILRTIHVFYFLRFMVRKVRSLKIIKK